MTVGLYFRLLFKGTPFRLILGLSFPSMMFQCFPFQPILLQRFWSLLAWSSLGISLMLIHRAMSEHMLISRSLPSLPCTGCSQRLFCTIFGPQLLWDKIKDWIEIIIRKCRASISNTNYTELRFTICTLLQS